MRSLLARLRPVPLVTVASIALGVAFVGAVLLVSDSLAVVAIAVPAAALLISNTVAMRVRGFAAELSVRHGVGASRKQLYRLVSRRAMVAGPIGAAVGCVIAAGIAGHVGLPLAAAFMFGVVVTPVAAVLSVRQVTSLSAGRPVRAWLGVAMLVAGLLMVTTHLSNIDTWVGTAGVSLLWLGLILGARLLAVAVIWPVASLLEIYGGARLASRDAMRQPQRVAALASAWITGVALVIAFAAVGTLLGLVALVAAFDIGRTLAQSGWERRQEIGLLRAVGASRPFIWRAVRQGGAMVAICGGALGLAFGILIGGVLQHVLLAQPLQDLAMPLPSVAAMLAVLAAAGTVAIWWPVARAVQPSQS